MMNAAHLHLIVNHLPIVGLGFALLINILALVRRSDDLARLTCWFYILIAVLAVMPILTGDGAGEIVKTYPGISNDVIELHETWGYIFFYGLLVNGILGLVALWLARKNKGFPIQLGMICLIVAVVLMFFAWKAGMTGGEIRHPEILQGTYPGL